jgi:hypothetical protein
MPSFDPIRSESVSKRILVALAPVIGLVLLSAGEPSNQVRLLGAVDPNPSLRSYTAVISLTIELHVLVPIRRTFEGKAYYDRPYRKIVFDHISGPLQRFRELSTALPTRADVQVDYSIGDPADDGSETTYVLTPIGGGHVRYLTIRVDDRTSLATDAAWVYDSGGNLDVHLQYSTFGSFRVPQEEDITASFPAYHASGVLRLSDYHFNGQ